MRNLSLNDVAVGVWSGHEVFCERIIPALNTWMRFFPEINIYTDNLPSDFDPNLIKNNSHINVSIISTNRETNYLIGSIFEFSWIKVQSRHIENLYHLYKTHPNSKWYIALDDDSYPLYSSILKSLSELNESKPGVYGFTFFAQPFDSQFFPNSLIPHLFSHGGSGIFISSSLMKEFEPKFHDCIYQEGVPYMPSDVRLMRCFETHFGSLNFQDNILNSLDGTHPVHFFESIPRENDWPILTFHQVSLPLISLLSFSTISEWTINNSDFFANWENLSLQSIVIDFGNNHLYQFLFGCALLQSSEQFSMPKLDTYTNVMIGIPHSPPLPVFDENFSLEKNISININETRKIEKFTTKINSIENQMQKSIVKYRQTFYRYKGELDHFMNQIKVKSNSNFNLNSNSNFLSYSNNTLENRNISNNVLSNVNLCNQLGNISSFKWKHEKDEKPIFIAEYICNQSLDTNEIFFAGLPDINDNVYKFYVHCPQISRFIHNFETGKTPFKHISLETDSFL